MMGALAFVPPQDVLRCFSIFLCAIPNKFRPIAQYFEVTYIRGKPARGRRRAVEARYEPHLWNQYNAVCQREVRTNNSSEGWHNRFQTVVGRHHPSLYAFFKEIQKEQGDTENMLKEIALGQHIRKGVENCGNLLISCQCNFHNSQFWQRMSNTYFLD